MPQANGEKSPASYGCFGAPTNSAAPLTIFGVVLGRQRNHARRRSPSPASTPQIQENVKQFGADNRLRHEMGSGPPRRARLPSRNASASPSRSKTRPRALEERCLAVKKRHPRSSPATGMSLTPSATKSGEVNAIDFRGVQPNFGLVYANAATLSGRFISEGDDLHKEKGRHAR